MVTRHIYLYLDPLPVCAVRYEDKTHIQVLNLNIFNRHIQLDPLSACAVLRRQTHVLLLNRACGAIEICYISVYGINQVYGWYVIKH